MVNNKNTALAISGERKPRTLTAEVEKIRNRGTKVVFIKTNKAYNNRYKVIAK